MSQTLPEGAFLLPADLGRIDAALAELKKTSNAHASVNVQVNLHVHYEYPKHVTILNAEGKEDTVVVNNEAEEMAALVPKIPIETEPTLIPETPLEPLVINPPVFAPTPLPSAADLDAIADEQKAAEQTA